MSSNISQNPKVEVSREEEVPSGASGSEVSVEATAEKQEKPKSKKIHCFTCRKNVGLIAFDCRCGHSFCGTHRYSDRHNCSFDYKADAVERLRRENPVVVGEKIQKI